MEYANTVTNTSLPAKHPIHYIKWWSGDLADESPVCGANRMDSTVWGYRTQYVRHVTCEECKRLIGPRVPEPFIPAGR